MDTDTPAVITHDYPHIIRPAAAEVFVPGTGWMPFTTFESAHPGIRLDAALTMRTLRRMARRGVTAVSVNIGHGRRADYTIRALTA